jgi:hypothetical protein
MADRPRMTADQLVDKLLASEHADVLRESIAWLVAELMDAEVATLVGAELGERAPDRRTTQRNGRPRTWDTRVGRTSWPSPSCALALTARASTRSPIVDGEPFSVSPPCHCARSTGVISTAAIAGTARSRRRSRPRLAVSSVSASGTT